MSEKEGNNRGWHTFLGAMIMIGVGFVGWLAYSVQQQSVAIATLQTQVMQVQASVSAVPNLTDRIAQNSARLAEYHAEIAAAARRLDRLESQDLKRWTK